MSLKTRYLDRENAKKQFMKFVKHPCCKFSKNGKDCVKKIVLNELMQLRQNFWEKTEEEQNQMILDEFNEQPFLNHLNLKVNGVPVCVKTWIFCHGISKARFYRLRYQYLVEGRRNGETCRKNAKDISPSTTRAINWLNKFSHDCGDRPPDESQTIRILPPCYTQLAVYETYKEAFEFPISLDYFRKIWKKHCSNITISKNNKFAKCGVCTLIKETKRNTKNAELRKELALKRDLHNKQQMGERAKYYRHRDKAATNPLMYASLIIDGMDQNKTGLPHFLRNSKSVEMHFLKTHITGVISHGTNQSWQFIDMHGWKHDSNFTLTVLFNSLMKISRDNQLPPILYLQFDNCWRENKNQYVLAFCSLLVKMKIVRKKFGNISNKLSKNNAPTVSALERLVKASYTPSPKVEKLKLVYNFKDWMQDSIRQLSKHTEPHAYKFQLNENSEVGVWFKRFSMDEDWHPLKSILSHTPVGAPSLVRPSWEKQISIEDMNTKLATCNLLLTPSEKEEWDSFVNSLQREQNKWKNLSDTRLHSITQSSFALSKFSEFKESPLLERISDTDRQRLDGINQILEKIQRVPQTKVGRSRREKRGETED